MDTKDYTSEFNRVSRAISDRGYVSNDIRNKIRDKMIGSISSPETRPGRSLIEKIRDDVGLTKPGNSKKAQRFIQKNIQTLSDRNTAKQSIGSSEHTFDNIRKSFKKKANTAGSHDYRYSTQFKKTQNRVFDDIIDNAKKTYKTSNNTTKNVLRDNAKKTAKATDNGTLKWLKDNKVGQIALGVGVTAWLVNKLSDSRGQQSNSQLYNQGGGY